MLFTYWPFLLIDPISQVFARPSIALSSDDLAKQPYDSLQDATKIQNLLSRALVNESDPQSTDRILPRGLCSSKEFLEEWDRLRDGDPVKDGDSVKDKDCTAWRHRPLQDNGPSTHYMDTIRE